MVDFSKFKDGAELIRYAHELNQKGDENEIKEFCDGLAEWGRKRGEEAKSNLIKNGILKEEDYDSWKKRFDVDILDLSPVFLIIDSKSSKDGDIKDFSFRTIDLGTGKNDIVSVVTCEKGNLYKMKDILIEYFKDYGLSILSEKEMIEDMIILSKNIKAKKTLSKSTNKGSIGG